jgi:hypothetical protein
MAKSIREAYGLESTVSKSSKFIAGTELEIEDVKGNNISIPWQAIPDGSLRNNGVEFVSPPLDTASLVDGFKHIHAHLICSKAKANFSERTSIHVHINCLDLDTEQVKSIVMWYALFEPVFFAMVDPHRKHNIHCVPLDQTHLSGQYKRPLQEMVERWSKYTALNLIPLHSQGTIEFRHMEGHNDAVKFEWWLKTIENLWQYGRMRPLTRASVLSPQPILEAFDAIFKDAPIHNIRSSVLSLCSDSLIDVKLSLI